MRFDQCCLLTGMRCRACHHLARSYGSLELRKRMRICGRLRCVELEIAGGGNARRAQIAIASGMGCGLGEAKIKAAKQRSYGMRSPPPALERALRQPGVQQDQRDAALCGRHDQAGQPSPFNKQAEVRPPMIEEAIHETGSVKRDELMNGPRE